MDCFAIKNKKAFMQNQIKIAHLALKSFLDSNEDFLWERAGLNHGFMDGGCKILADVLLEHIKPLFHDANLYFIKRAYIDGADHIATGIYINNELYLMDTNGIQTKSEFIDNFIGELSPIDASVPIEIGEFIEGSPIYNTTAESEFGMYDDLDLIRNKLALEITKTGLLKNFLLFAKKQNIRDIIEYKIERDDDDEGLFVSAHSLLECDVKGRSLCVGHLHVPDEAVSVFNTYRIGDIDVSEPYRRYGVATEMLDKASEHLQAKPIGANSYFSKDGEAFWDNYKTKQKDQEVDFVIKKI